MIKLIIFDFDGVIINEYKEHYRLGQKQISNLTEEEFKKLFEGNFHVEREKLKERDTEFDLKEAFSKHKSTITVSSEIRRYLRELSKKYVLGIISSAKEEGTSITILNSGLKGIFLFNYGFETNPSKVEKFNKVLRENNFPKNEIIFVTDTLGDIKEANKVGIKTIAIDLGYHEKERLEKGNPYKIVSSFEELYEEIKTEENYFSSSSF